MFFLWGRISASVTSLLSRAPRTYSHFLTRSHILCGSITTIFPFLPFVWFAFWKHPDTYHAPLNCVNKLRMFSAPLDCAHEVSMKVFRVCATEVEWCTKVFMVMHRKVEPRTLACVYIHTCIHPDHTQHEPKRLAYMHTNTFKPTRTHAHTQHLSLLCPSWKLSKEGDRISRCFTAKNFMAGMEFLNALAKLAEDEGHHPDLSLTDYNCVTVTLWTHSREPHQALVCLPSRCTCVGIDACLVFVVCLCSTLAMRMCKDVHICNLCVLFGWTHLHVLCVYVTRTMTQEQAACCPHVVSFM